MLALGGVAYGYASGVIPPLSFFSHEPYDRAHLLQGIAQGFGTIQTSSFKVDLALQSEPRDEGVYPLDLTDTSTKRSLEYLSNYIPAEFKLIVSFGGSTETSSSQNARVTLAGSLQSTDFSMEAALEARKVGDTLYFLISKFPSIVYDVSAVRGTWIAVTPADQSSYLGTNRTSFLIGSTTPQEQAAAREKLKRLLGIADEQQLFVAQGDAERTTLDGSGVYHYALALNPEAVVRFYEAVEVEFKDDPSLRLDPGTLDYLRSADGQRLLAYLGDHMTFEIWAVSDGTPHKMRLSMRLVPSDDIVRMKDKQVRLSVGLDLLDINRPVQIDAPETSISLDEAERLIFGSSLSDTRARGRDARRIADLRHIQLGLELYYSDYGRYPAALSLLAPGYLPNVPVDPADSISYTYRVSGGSYQLGADLEKSTSTSESKSCGGVAGRYCYRVSP